MGRRETAADEFRAETGLEVFPAVVKRIEREMPGQAQLKISIGDHVAGSQSDKDGARLLGQVMEAKPGLVGDLFQSAMRQQLEIENDQGQITIPEEKIGGP